MSTLKGKVITALLIILIISSCENNQSYKLENDVRLDIKSFLNEVGIDENFKYKKIPTIKGNSENTHKNNLLKFGLKGKVKILTQFTITEDSSLLNIKSKPIISYSSSFDKTGNRIKYIAYDSVGILDYYKNFNYDSNGNNIEEMRYDKHDSLTEHIKKYFLTNGKEYKYETIKAWIKPPLNYVRKYDKDFNEIAIIYYGKHGLEGVSKIKYNSNGNIAEKKRYNKKGFLLSSINHEYNNFGDLKTEYSVSHEKQLHRREYNYDNEGNLLTSYYYNSINNMRLSSIESYNSKGEIIETKKIDNNEAQISREKLKRDKNGKVYNISFYDARDQLFNKRIYRNLDFDKYGNWKTLFIIEISGKIEIITREIEYY